MRHLVSIPAVILVILAHGCAVSPDRELLDDIRNARDAVYMYRHEFGTYPAAIIASDDETMLRSWRLTVAGYDQPFPINGNFSPDMRRKWDSPENALLLDARWGQSFRQKSRSNASVFAVVSDDGPWAPIGIQTSSAQFAGQTDMKGKAYPPHLIVMVTVKNTNVLWPEPGDIAVSDVEAAWADKRVEDISLLTNPLSVLFYDGTIWRIDGRAPCRSLMSLMKTTSAIVNDRDRELGVYRIKE